MQDQPDYKYCDLVQITSEAYSSCLNHALMTDSEEILGLLIGNNIQSKSNKNIIRIFATICLTRKCKQKDRVEFDEVQIAKAVEIAEELKIKNNNTPCNVIGWYHSHPKITIPPSHVDLNTQKSQQYQGCFVGLIISCFSTDSSNINKINLLAFQTKRNDYDLVPHYIDIEFINEIDVFGNTWSNTANSALMFGSLLRNLLDEEEEEFQKEKDKIDDDDNINRVLLMSSRQSLLCKIIQNVSTPYIKSLNSEIFNLKNYLAFIKEKNNSLRNTIKNLEEINSLNS